MIQMTINKKEVQDFSTFLTQNELSEFFFAKDEGAYVGATALEKGERVSWIKYFAGCNPEKDADYYDNARDKFGGDDFGEFFSADFIHKMASRGWKIVVRISPSRIALVGKGVKS